MKKVLYILAAVVLVIINATPVLETTTAVVTILGIPAYTGGILTFNVVYVSDTEMDLSWTVGAGVANVMVRAKYGSYPANPPNSSTAPSDGYLVYYGSDLSAVDTSMDMNQNAGTLYYSAWAQKADGTWFVTTSTGSEESKKMLLLFLGLLPLVLLGMGYGFKKSWILWLSIPFWFILGVYIGFFQDWFSNPTAQHSLILISIAASVAIGLAALRMQIAPLSNSATNMDGDDELDDDDNDFLREAKQYEKNSIIYKTKLKPRR